MLYFIKSVRILFVSANMFLFIDSVSYSSPLFENPAFGKFTSGPPTVTFTGIPEDCHSTVFLKSEVKFVDPNNREWIAPEGTISNGSSIPCGIELFLRGGPYHGLFLEPGLVHDYEYGVKKNPKEEVDLMYYNALRAKGVGPTRASFMYGAVYLFGPRWPHSISVRLKNFNSLDAAKREVLIGKIQGSRIDSESVYANGDGPFALGIAQKMIYAGRYSFEKDEITVSFKIVPPEPISHRFFKDYAEWFGRYADQLTVGKSNNCSEFNNTALLCDDFSAEHDELKIDKIRNWKPSSTK